MDTSGFVCTSCPIGTSTEGLTGATTVDQCSKSGICHTPIHIYLLQEFLLSKIQRQQISHIASFLDTCLPGYGGISCETCPVDTYKDFLSTDVCTPYPTGSSTNGQITPQSLDDCSQ